MTRNENDVYMLSIRSQLNKLYVLLKVINGSADDNDPDIRALSLQALQAIWNTTQELAVKLSDYLVIKDTEGGEN